MITITGSQPLSEMPDLTLAERWAARSYERRDRLRRNVSLSLVSVALSAGAAFSRGQTTFGIVCALTAVMVALSAFQDHGYHQLIERFESDRSK